MKVRKVRNVRIRLAKRSDIKSIGRINKRYFHGTYPEIEHVDYISERIKDSTYYIATLNGRNIGAMGLAIHDGYKRPYIALEALAVSTLYQGKGIGFKLVSKAIEVACRNGIDYIGVSTDEEYGAKGFYKKCGFKHYQTRDIGGIKIIDLNMEL